MFTKVSTSLNVSKDRFIWEEIYSGPKVTINPFHFLPKTVSKKKNKNKNKVTHWKDSSNFVTAPTTSAPTTMTTTMSTTTSTTEKSYPPAPVYFKERKKKRKQHLTESKMYYMPFKSNGQPNLKNLLDTMAQSGLFDSSGVKGGKKKRKNSYNGNYY